ncbi:MAG: hypothetical protein KDA42_16585 [Planctomycetales bacterium]|nr:hypothetical protein [Planctomycetales bacterium]
MTDESMATQARQWYIALRWQEYEGEGRANLLRIIAVGAFYTLHLLNYHQVNLGFLQLGENYSVSLAFHQAVTAIAVAWTMLAMGIQVCLRQQIFPHWLKFLSTSCDVILLSAILYLGDGPRSPLIVGYFLILALAALRLSLPLIRFTTPAVALGYLAILGVAKWPQTFGRGNVDLRVPRYEQLIVLIAITLAGVLLGQVLRRMRSLAESVIERLEALESSR